MPTVRFTSHLQRFFPGLKSGLQVDAHTVAEVVRVLDQSYPGFAGYIVDEHGKLRKHVNIFVGDSLIDDRETLTDPLTDNHQVYIMQALSGG